MKVKELGEFIRSQRRGAQMSLRKLARAAGVSNPYLSQIERGLRRPSAEILQAIAKALRMSSQTLYVQAGILDAEPHPDVHTAIVGDPSLTEKQKQVLLSVYDSFREETGRRRSKGNKAAKKGEPVISPRRTRPAATPTRGKVGRAGAVRVRTATSPLGKTRGRTETQADPKPSPGSPPSFRRHSSVPKANRKEV